MRVLVVGSGGREHALVWKLKQEAEVFCAPGNAGTATECETINVAATDGPGLIKAALDRGIDLVVIGPEDPLIAGIADDLRSSGASVFGPGRDGARLEASKAFSKDLMLAAGVPTAASGTFSDFALSVDYVKSKFAFGQQVAIKASGPALGKGVVVCDDLDQAIEALETMLERGELGDAGTTVVIEDRLVGREFSLLTLVSGRNFRSLPVAQDYKRALDGDAGPNTGGMGSYSPVPWVTDSLLAESEATVVKPMVEELWSRGIDYRGVLFSGLMVQDAKPFCLEYNVRFGDPETQSVLMRLGGGFAEALSTVASGGEIPDFEVKDNSVVSVVLASRGYPGDYKKGVPIKIGQRVEGVKVFHAGTRLMDGQLVTNGGRVLAVTAEAQTLTRLVDLLMPEPNALNLTANNTAQTSLLAYNASMVSVVLLALLVQQDKVETYKGIPFFDFVIGTPTGKNGYEEYVRATTMIPREAKEAIQAAVKFGEPGWLGSQRTIATFATALEAEIARGNQKVVRYPKDEFDLATLFPELAKFKEVQKILAASATASFADGRPAAACATLATMLDFGTKVSSTGGEIHYLVGLAMTSMACQVASRSLSQIPLSGTSPLIAAAERGLQLDTCGESLLREMDSDRRTVEKMVQNPRQTLIDVGIKAEEIDAVDDEGSVNKYGTWCKTPLERRKVLGQLAVAAIASKGAYFEESLKLSEDQWADRHWSVDDDKRFAFTAVPLLDEFGSGSSACFLTAELSRRTNLRLPAPPLSCHRIPLDARRIAFKLKASGRRLAGERPCF